jgi:phosphopantetheinyl transferase (holo-ACP synthase)
LDAEVKNGEEGQPLLHFSEKGRALLDQKGASEALVSLTHLESIASAIVVLVSTR